MNVSRHHAEWLNLVPTSGPFLSLPVLLQRFPQGLDDYAPGERAELKEVYAEWEAEHASTQPDRAIHRQWVRYMLERVLCYPPELLAEGQDLGAELSVTVPVYHETLQPDLALRDPDGQGAEKARLLVQILAPGQALDASLPGRTWTASPATRMGDLLLGAGVRLGLLTNGEHWMLVNARRGESTGFASWYGNLWLEEPLTLRAFRSLLDVRRFFGVGAGETIEALLDQSAENQQEVTDRLGVQVRQAMQVLIQALDRSDKDRGRALLRDVDERTLYEAALTVMMRLVFLFSAEERGMLQLGNDLYDGYYAVSTLRAQLDAVAAQAGEEVLERRYDAWPRLLAAFRAVYGGVWHEQLQIPAYGGHLFDPDRFPFLEGRAAGMGWRTAPTRPLPVNNRAVLHLLKALQVLQVRVPGGGVTSRVLSFRALDIEQIGTVYEGLLDHTAVRAREPLLGLVGPKDREPEIPLAALEAERAQGEDRLIAYLQEQTGRSDAALRKALAHDPSGERERGLRAACDNDESLHGRVLPFAGLLRRDSNELPVVVAAGSVYVTAGTDRRATGTHYTPRSLTEPIVRYTLEPLAYDGPAEGLPEERWRLRSPGELLALRICDMAMGSGAFLVQACRYLGDLLVESWQRLEEANPGQKLVTPEGTLSRGDPGEKLFMSDPEERAVEARRLVADRCLFGVDKNPAAVEMAKLSLWLVTMQRDRPFTFLDHALKWGDSLLGVDLAQLTGWSLQRERTGQLSWVQPIVHRALEHAQRLRTRIAALPDHAVDSAEPLKNIEQKAAWLREADEAVELVKLGADLLVATGLAPQAERDNLRTDLLARYQLAMAAAEEHRGHPFTPVGQAEMIAAREDLREEARGLLRDRKADEGRRPFHWFLEFPEVFTDIAAWEAPRGFDAIIGNPPFQGGQKITGVLGTDYRDYLVEYLAGGRRGSADLVAYFFLRGYGLLREGGDLSLLATNTIAQGDTREVGLDQILAQGAAIIRAVPSRKWPGEANLEVAEIWLRRGEWHGSYTLGDQPVPGITAFLSPPGAVEGKPQRLKANEGKSFQGSIVLGMGFVLEPEQAQALIARDPRNRDVLFPYLNGEDLNSRPDQSPSRWVINFHDWPLERAETYPEVMAIVREKVKPERDKNNRAQRRERWWRYAERAPALYATIAGMERVLATARVSKHLAFSYTPTGIVSSEQTVIIADPAWYRLAILQSTWHQDWVIAYQSSLETRGRYTPSDCFETFTFPTSSAGLDDIGERYYTHRQAIMLARQEGLTRTYNRFHNPAERAEDIAVLRRLHIEMDHAVAAAYGWADLDLGHGFHQTKQGLRYTIGEPARHEVLGRLLALNHARYAEEVKQGLHDRGAKKSKAASTGAAKGKRARAGTQDEPKQAALFGD